MSGADIQALGTLLLGAVGIVAVASIGRLLFLRFGPELKKFLFKECQ